jgi:hypothetical protein
LNPKLLNRNRREITAVVWTYKENRLNENIEKGIGIKM